jgi:hypothetical protein
MIKRLSILILAVILQNVAFAQLEDNEELENIITFDTQVSKEIADGKLYTHSLDFNSSKKDWLGIEGYRETINCYFKILEDTKEVELVKIVVVLEKKGEQALKSYLYSPDQHPIMCYNTFLKDGEMLGNQGAYFGKGTIVALSVNDAIVVGDGLTDAMVNSARDMYLNGERYRQILEKVMSLQSQ